MVFLLTKIMNWIWSEHFWIPSDLSWKDFEHTQENQMPNFTDPLTYSLIFAILYLLVKSFIIVPIFLQIAKLHGINCVRPPHPKSCQLLEEMHKKFDGKIPKLKLSQAADDLGWTSIKVEHWLFLNSRKNKLTKGEKFAEIGFQFVHHTLYGMMGVFVLWTKPWLWDMSLCYKGYPVHPVPAEVWWYYMIPLGFFWSAMLHQVFFEPTRKDSIINLIHHAVSILLMSFSWIVNLVRIGTIVLFIHHFVDGILLAAKLSIYLRKQKVADVMFVMAFLTWIITRIIIFPFWIIHSAIYEAPKINFMPAAYVFYGCLMLLQALNILWFGMFIKVAYVKLVYGKIEDLRSSDEEEFNPSQDKEK